MLYEVITGIADWEKELEPHYRTAEKMLGATTNPGLYEADFALRDLAAEYGVEGRFVITSYSIHYTKLYDSIRSKFNLFYDHCREHLAVG